MAQNWLGLCNENLTELKSHNKYQLDNATATIVYWDNWNDVGNNFVCYMPSSNSFICGRPAIRFHDCYKASNGKGYAHASFAFRAPGYIAGFPIDFGFASIKQDGTLSVIGQSKSIQRPLKGREQKLIGMLPLKRLLPGQRFQLELSRLLLLVEWNLPRDSMVQNRTLL